MDSLIWILSFLVITLVGAGASSEELGPSYQATIATQWNGTALPGPHTEVSLKRDSDFVVVETRAKFYDDPAPQGEPYSPFWKLWDYEVVEVFFLNHRDQYLEVEIGPHGHHLILLLDGKHNAVKHSLPLNLSVDIKGQEWTATARIPACYFPPNVHKWNAYAIHGVGEERTYEALYPADAKLKAPDFHALEYFRLLPSADELIPENSEEDGLWPQLQKSCA